MSIPTDHFTKTAVISLDDSKAEKIGSEPNSPLSHRHNMSVISRLGCEETNCLHESLDPSLNMKQSQLMTSSLTNLAQNIDQDEYENSTGTLCKNSGGNTR